MRFRCFYNVHIMAKTAKSPDDLEAYAAQLEGYAKTLRDVVAAMRAVKMPYHFCHSGTVESHHLPQIERWVGQINLDFKPALRAFEKGAKSRTEVVKDYKERKKKPKPKG